MLSPALELAQWKFIFRTISGETFCPAKRCGSSSVPWFKQTCPRRVWDYLSQVWNTFLEDAAREPQLWVNEAMRRLPLVLDCQTAGCCVSILAHKVRILAYAVCATTSVAMGYDAKDASRVVPFI